MSTYIFYFPTLIHFGPGARSALSPCLKSEGFRRPLIVTDHGIATLPFCEEIQKELSSAGMKVGLFSGVFGNPVKSQVIAGVDAYRAHHADCIIGLGGGAALDVAKAIALMIHHPGDLFDYEDGEPNARPINGPIPFWVALPTASGTGSEVGRSTVISDDTTHIKKIIFSPRLMARAVFADPELTLDLSPRITAATGMDALTHCVESFLAKGYHPICDGMAIEGLRLAAQNLVPCVKTPHDLQARGAMMMASIMGAIAFQKGLGITHSCAHPLSTLFNLHHGLSNGIMINYALPFNLAAAPERFERMAMTIGLPDQTGEGFLRWLSSLKEEIGIPKRLSDVGVAREAVHRLSELAVRDVCHQCNPRPCSLEDFRKIYSDAM